MRGWLYAGSMKRWQLVVVVLIGLLLVAAGGLYFALNSLISGDGKTKALAAVSDKLKTRVDVQTFGIDLASLFRLKPTLSLSGITVANPQGFSNENLLEAATVRASMDLSDVLSKRFRLTSLEVEKPRILVETAASGKSNLEALLDNINGPKSDAPAAKGGEAESAAEFSAGRMAISGAEVRIRQATDKAPRVMLRDLDLTISGFEQGKPSDLKLSSSLFSAGPAKLTMDGSVGPMAPQSLPLDAKTRIELPLGKIPSEIRAAYFGDLVADPGNDSNAALDLAVKGNLEESIAGSGQAVLEKFMVGPAAQSRLVMNGKIPIALKGERPLADGPVTLNSKGAALQLGKGGFNGDIALRKSGAQMSGSIAGAVQGVDINEMLTSFAATPGKVYGTASVPKLAVQFAGATPQQIKNSLAGNGAISIQGAKFPGIDVLGAIERALGGNAAAKGERTGQFDTNFDIGGQRVNLNGISGRSSDMQVTGQGTVTFSEAVNFALTAAVTGQSAQGLASLTRGYSGSSLRVPVNITGTLDQPQIRPDTKGLMKSAATGAAQSVLDRFLKKK